MTNKPTTVAGYEPENLGDVYSTCLYLATRFGDFFDDIVVVGGLVPSLLVNQSEFIWDTDAHAGTLDLDVGLAPDLLDEERYRNFRERLQEAGFVPDLNETGNPSHQRWRTTFSPPVTIDFLIPPSADGDEGGRLRHILPGFAAFITPGLHTAFSDRQRVALQGRTPVGEEAQREVWVCGPGAFTVLKALAFHHRGSGKDAYDMAFVWYGLGVERVAESLEPMLGDSDVERGLDIIRENFTDLDSTGPRRAAGFLADGPYDGIRADTVGLATSLLSMLSRLE